MSTASIGRAYEYKVRNELVKHGWVPVFRAAGSKGPADIGLAHPFHGLALIQVGKEGKTLGPEARNRLVSVAHLCSALALLAVVTPYQPIRYFEVTRDVPSAWNEWSPA